jgi:hypothetical protein
MAGEAVEDITWQRYVSTAQALQYMQKDQSSLGSSNSDLSLNMELFIDACCDWVQDTLNKPLAPTQFTYRFDGAAGLNGAYIMLPFYPVISIDSVTEWLGQSAQELQESTPDSQADGYQIAKRTGRLTRVFQGNMPKPWFPGSRNIEVSWTAGYQTVPPRLLLGTLELIAYWWRNKEDQPAWKPGDTGYDQGAGQQSTSFLAGTPQDILNMLFPTSQISIG